MNGASFTPGPWPITQTGDGKRWVIGKGLVEGPNGYEVAEVYADDAPYLVTYANAHLIAAAPELFSVVADMFDNPDFQVTIGSNPIRIDELINRAHAALAKARGETL